ncbi:acyltransferase [Dyadobacter sp. LJ53]|uniref:acyltransferase family protein n=1 Tax=Dyadobacter chenwenxiniae TaxID=2906456 RepID=UPI001F1E4411|nr:acyltransferase [Dyadobacter chenwenxiniae]MCF0050063.1 acyltransferase [Dyadobacter chenwenxiniae]
MQKQQEYFRQLDGLRAIAIILVILFHWFPEGEGINVLANGPLGVTLFFVLSGFLITRILLVSKASVEEAGLAQTYKNFLLRRGLRIFPLYYFLLFVIWQAKSIPFIPTVNTDFYTYPAHYILYISNFLLEKTANWSDLLSTLWSLSVEEQFYLFWPLIILSVRVRFIKNVIAGTIALGIISRLLLSFFGHNLGVLMPTCLDAFGLGALWAYVLVYDRSPEIFLRKLKIFAAGGLTFFLFFCLTHADSVLVTLFFRTSMAVFCLFFVAHASHGNGFRSVVGKILNHSALRYIGKISYGLYIYHMVVPSILLPLLIKIFQRILKIEIILTEAMGKVVSLALVIAVASLSWFFFESPINGLKKYINLRTVRMQVNRH